MLKLHKLQIPLHFDVLLVINKSKQLYFLKKKVLSPLPPQNFDF